MFELKSKRLYYKKITAKDQDNYLRLNTNAAVMKYITGRAMTVIESMNKFEKVLVENKRFEELGIYMAYLEDDTFIGLCKLQHKPDNAAEVGYVLLPEFWRQGFATEIAEYLVNYAETLPIVDRVFGMIDPENIASKKILMAQGMTLYEVTTWEGLPAEVYSRTF